MRIASRIVGVVLALAGHAWAAWPLVLVWIGLIVVGRQIAKPGTMDLDWQTVPERLRPVLRAMVNVVGVAFLILAALFVWNHWSRYQVPAQLVQAGLITFAFAWEALFFAFGTVRADQELATSPLAPPPARL